MKKKFLDYSLKLIKNNKPELNDDRLAEIRYGLEGIYLTITKTIFIFTLAYILGIFKEMFLMLVFFNILRTTGFGLHASKSWMCWVSSTIIFILLPFLSRMFIIPFQIKLILGIISIVLIYLYAPADTSRHPLVNERKRNILKFITTISCIILVYFCLIIKDETISNLIIFGIYTEVVFINPITYKIFHLNYNNYQNYILSH